MIAALAFDSNLAYPGWPALVPSLGAAAVIIGGNRRFGPGRLLSVPPLRWLGRISYSLYLVHWPVLVLGPLVLGGEPEIPARVLLVLVALASAVASYTLVETPYRRGLSFLGPRPFPTVSFGVAWVAAVVLLCTGISTTTLDVDTVAAAPPDTQATALLAAATDEPWVEASLLPIPDETGGDGGSGAPVDAAATAPLTSGGAPPASASPTDAPPDGPVALARDVTPPLRAARADEERLRADGCLAFEQDTEPGDCVYGDPAGAVTIALVGDSHAAQWFPAVDRLARHAGWRLVVFTKVSCPFLDMLVTNTSLKREYRECTAWNEAVVTKLRRLHPTLTLISVSRLATHPVRAADSGVDARGAALARMIEQLRGRVAVIVDTPNPGLNVPGCLSAHTSDVRRCAVPRAKAFAGALGEVERIAAGKTGAGVVDLTAYICPDDGACPVVVDNHIVFRDESHLTATFARSLAPALAAAVAPLIDEPQAAP